MRRRDLILGGAAGLVALPALAAENPLSAAASAAYIYALPMVEVANVREHFLARGAKPQKFYGRNQLATSESRGVTTPNNDTLTAEAFIDLSRGPALLKVPPLDGRYASLALMDMFTNNFRVLSPRTIGDRGGVYRLVGPTETRYPDAIRSPTPWVWSLVRVLVDGPHDLDEAGDVLAGFQIAAAEAGSFAAGAPRAGPWPDYFQAINRLLLENPPPPADSAMLATLAPLGLGSPGFDPGRFQGADAADIAAGVEAARALLSGASLGTGDTKGGWTFEAPDTGDFGQDYERRARVAIGGLAALPLAEAMYLSALDPGGKRRFTGDGPWRISFPAGETPPVDAFWSLTMYEATPDGQFFLTANPIGRYSIGNRTPGLIHDPDGALTLWISRTDPGPARHANWLPAPAQGPFALILRAYLPRPALRSHAYIPPPVTAA